MSYIKIFHTQVRQIRNVEPKLRLGEATSCSFFSLLASFSDAGRLREVAAEIRADVEDGPAPKTDVSAEPGVHAEMFSRTSSRAPEFDEGTDERLG